MSGRAPVLVLGGSGLLGRAVVETFARRGLDPVAPPHSALDLERSEAMAAGFEAYAPRAVVNLAAFTDVDAAERPEQRERLYRVNRDAPAQLARLCAQRQIPFVHVSTDYVFDGHAVRPYGEEDAPRPIQEYGRSKLAGEQAVLEAYPAALVVRTSSLFGPPPPGRRTFVDTVWSRARAGQEVWSVEAPEASPTFTRDLAQALADLLQREVGGVLHVTNGGSCTRIELARAVVALAGLSDRISVEPRAYPPGSAARPRYCALDSSRLAGLLGAPLRPWREALAAYLGSGGR